MTPQAAGYSGTPLLKKLGMKPGARIQVIRAPDGFALTLGETSSGLKFVRRLRDR